MRWSSWEGATRMGSPHTVCWRTLRWRVGEECVHVSIVVGACWLGVMRGDVNDVGLAAGMTEASRSVTSWSVRRGHCYIHALAITSVTRRPGRVVSLSAWQVLRPSPACMPIWAHAHPHASGMVCWLCYTSSQCLVKSTGKRSSGVLPWKSRKYVCEMSLRTGQTGQTGIVCGVHLLRLPAGNAAMQAK